MISIDFRPYLRDGIDVYINETDKTVFFVFLSTRQRIQLNVDEDLVLLLPKMDGKNRVSDLISLSNPNRKQQVIFFIDYLFRKGIVTDIDWFETLPFDTFYKKKLERQLFFLMDMTSSKDDVLRVQQKIKNSTVAICGVGAVGSWLLVELLQMGFEHIKILDSGIVQDSDLTRHAFFSKGDCTLSKVSAYKKIGLQIEPNAKIDAYECNISTELDLDQYFSDVDIIFNCADEPYIGYTSIHISRYCVSKNKILFVCGGFDAHLACLGELIVPYITPCSDCYNSHFKKVLKDWKPIKHTITDRKKGIGGLVSLNIFSASSAALSLLKFFVDPTSIEKGSGRGEFRFTDYSIDHFHVPRNKNCVVCHDK